MTTGQQAWASELAAEAPGTETTRAEAETVETVDLSGGSSETPEERTGGVSQPWPPLGIKQPSGTYVLLPAEDLKRLQKAAETFMVFSAQEDVRNRLHAEAVQQERVANEATQEARVRAEAMQVARDANLARATVSAELQAAAVQGLFRMFERIATACEAMVDIMAAELAHTRKVFAEERFTVVRSPKKPAKRAKKQKKKAAHGGRR